MKKVALIIAMLGSVAVCHAQDQIEVARARSLDGETHKAILTLRRAAPLDEVNGFAISVQPNGSVRLGLRQRGERGSLCGLKQFASVEEARAEFSRLPLLNLSSAWLSASDYVLRLELGDQGYDLVALDLGSTRYWEPEEAAEGFLENCSSDGWELVANSRLSAIQRANPALDTGLSSRPVALDEGRSGVAAGFDSHNPTGGGRDRAQTDDVAKSQQRGMSHVTVWTWVIWLLLAFLASVLLWVLFRWFKAWSEKRDKVKFQDSIAQKTGQYTRAAPKTQRLGSGSGITEQPASDHIGGEMSEHDRVQSALQDIGYARQQLNEVASELAVTQQRLDEVVGPLVRENASLAEANTNFTRSQQQLSDQISELTKGNSEAENKARELHRRLVTSQESRRNILTLVGYPDDPSFDPEVHWEQLAGGGKDHFASAFLFLYPLAVLRDHLEQRRPVDVIDDVCRLPAIRDHLGRIDLPGRFSETDADALQKRLIGDWRDLLSKIFCAALLMRTVWPDRDEQLLRHLELVAANLRNAVLERFRIRPHTITLPMPVEPGSQRFLGRGVLDEKLAKSRRFQQLMRKRSERESIFCQVSSWGYDKFDGNRWIVQEPSRLAAKGPGDHWDQPVHD